MAVFNFRNAVIVLLGLVIAQHIVYGMTINVLTDRIDEIRSIAEMQNGWVFFDLSK